MEEKRPTLVHKHDWGSKHYGDGSGEWSWRRPSPPDPTIISDIRTADPFWTCGYCGSMHPSELVAAIEGGATVEMADRKYGWPHKAYVSNAPNRFEGMMEIRGATTKGGVTTPHPETPAGPAWGKFYTIHLQDATEAEREAIEKAIGLRISFAGGSVKWEPYQEGDKPC